MSQQPDDYYRQMLARVDAFFAAAAARHPQGIACRSGCSGCCQVHLSVFPLEAARVGEAVAALPPGVQQRLVGQARAVEAGERAACPLLVDDRCAVYASRPFICRSHGLPVRFVDERGAAQVDVCPLCFDQQPIPDDAVLDLDQLNELLVAVNAYAARRSGVEPGARRTLAEVVRTAAAAAESLGS